MNQSTLPSYKRLSEALKKTTLKLHASQAHGMISGILCGDIQKKADWEKIITGGKDPETTHEILQILYQVSSKQLEDFIFDFQLILPKDSEALPERAEALTLWCQGFLTGLKFVQVPIENRSDSDITEAINDLVEIAKMNYEDVIANEEDEVAYTELVEYVRMAIILIYQDMRENKEDKKISQTSAKHLQ